VSIASGSEEDVATDGQPSQVDANTRKMSGIRWMEKQEARSIRLAMQEMDKQGPVAEVSTTQVLQPDSEDEVDRNAREEAEELIRTHQQGKQPQQMQNSAIKGRKVRNEPASNGSANSSRVASDSSTRSSDSVATGDGSPSRAKRFVKFAVPDDKTGASGTDSERTSSRESNASRSSSGSFGVFNRPRSGSGSALANIIPLHLRNPFSRARTARQSAPPLQNPTNINSPADITVESSNQRFERVEIQRNPPTQSKNPTYTTNTKSPAATSPQEVLATLEDVTNELRIKDGKEIRAEDIRKATSRSLKDRSPLLPTPSAVSSKQGRPIVSFDKEWKPKQDETSQGFQRPLKYGPRDEPAAPSQRSSQMSMSAASGTMANKPPIPILNFPDEEQPRKNSLPAIHISSAQGVKPHIPAIAVSNA
jgi:hypothetical protein